MNLGMKDEMRREERREERKERGERIIKRRYYKYKQGERDAELGLGYCSI